MKWSYIQPSSGVYDFSKFDKLVNYANKNGMEIDGHTLVWYKSVPQWVTQELDQIPEKERGALLEKLITDYITTVISRYSNTIVRWDVVNEALENPKKANNYNVFRSDNIFDKYLYDKDGDGVPDYITIAYRAAHKANPNAKLYYNDYNIEYLDPSGIFPPGQKFDEVKTKSENSLRFVKKLIQAGVPINGVGIQAHIVDPVALDDNILNTETVKDYPLYKSMLEYAGLGLEVRISEMDVRVSSDKSGKPRNIDLIKQANTYQNYLFTCLQIKSCISFTVWQFSDNFIWYGDDFPGKKEDYFPTLFTRDWKPKPAYTALVKTLKE